MKLVILLAFSAYASMYFCDVVRGESVRWEDPGDDDVGAGRYRYPGLTALPPGLLDLRAIEFERDDDQMVIRAVVARKIPTANQIRTAEDEIQNVFYLQVDIYLDVDGNPQNGRHQLIPGRNVALSAGNAWDIAIVLTPIPLRVRAALLRDPTRHANVHTPNHISVKGKVLEARLPASLFGDRPMAQWGVVALTTSPTFSTSIGPWVDADTPAANNIYTREITANPGVCGQWKEEADGTPCTFGGCSPCSNHPRVFDVLLPLEVDQTAHLARYSETQIATVPLWYREKPTLTNTLVTPSGASPTPPTLNRLPLIAIDGKNATALIPDPPITGLKPGIFVDLVDKVGANTGVAVVTDMVGKVIILHASSGISPTTNAFVVRGSAEIRK